MLGTGTRVSIWMPFEKAPGIRIFKYPEVRALSMNAITKKAYILTRGWPVLASYVMVYVVFVHSYNRPIRWTVYITRHLSENDFILLMSVMTELLSMLCFLVTTHILHSMVTLARPPIRFSLKITNRSFRYAAPCLWNELPHPTELREPRQSSDTVSCTCTYHIHAWQFIIFTIFTITSCIFSYSLSILILNSRLGSLANLFLHRPFPFLPDWLHGLSDHLTFLLCSAAVLVSVLD